MVEFPAPERVDISYWGIGHRCKHVMAIAGHGARHELSLTLSASHRHARRIAAPPYHGHPAQDRTHERAQTQAIVKNALLSTLSHFQIVALAYIISAGVLIALTVWIVADLRIQRRRLARLETQHTPHDATP